MGAGFRLILLEFQKFEIFLTHRTVKFQLRYIIFWGFIFQYNKISKILSVLKYHASNTKKGEKYLTMMLK